MAVLGLRFCARAFSSCGKRGPLFIAVRGPLTIAASPVAEHRLQTRRLSTCGSRAQLLRGMWDLPRPGLESVSPALAGRFSTTAPPGKPHWCVFKALSVALGSVFLWDATYQIKLSSTLCLASLSSMTNFRTNAPLGNEMPVAPNPQPLVTGKGLRHMRFLLHWKLFTPLLAHPSGLSLYRHTSELLWVRFQTATIKQIMQESLSHEFFGFPVHIKVMFTLYCSLLSVQ